MVARVAVALAAVFLAAATAAVVLRPSPPDPRGTARALARAWSAGDDAAFGRLTDAPAAAAGTLRQNRAGLDGARAAVRLVRVDASDDHEAWATFAVRWTIPGGGPFGYRTRTALHRTDEDWRVRWRPSVVHPRLTADRRLGTERTSVERGAIRDRRGRALVRDRAVVRIGIDRSRTRDDGAAARRLAAALDLDPATYARQVRRAGPAQFVEAITLRADEWTAKASRVRAVHGAVAIDDERPLAPSRAFARALLGGVGEATAEQEQASAGRLRPGAMTGQWGLQRRFDRQLAGVPGAAVVLRHGQAVLATLRPSRARDGRAVRTTLDRDVQAAAETALADDPRKIALVALQPSTGDVLAVANRPVDDTFDRALAGRYPPGSTFKVATTLALLRDGLDPATPVGCPATTNVDGRRFKNFENGASGNVPFSVDFAESCNTAFVALSDRVAGRALPRAARSLGLGASVDLPVDAPAASVPAPRTPVERASAAIGQDRILASPLAMAGVAAAVADGRPRAPRLLADDPRRAGPTLAPGELGRLRTLMRGVVTGGTGTALAGVRGEPAGKSGTAEYGSGDPPPTHAWFIGYRGDLAFAVLVEGGRAGGTVAAPIAARFLAALDG